MDSAQIRYRRNVVVKERWLTVLAGIAVAVCLGCMMASIQDLVLFCFWLFPLAFAVAIVIININISKGGKNHG